MTPVNFGTSLLAFIRENVGLDKNLLIIEDKFFKQEFNSNIDSATVVIRENGIFCNRISDKRKTYLAIASTQQKIDQYLDSETENEFQATILEAR